ncbi:hypothetical protein BJ138DRAFT_1120937 [Hygrophoropsis aurantiaca]|uniref:Uncharacterized protein n=1 Tax=Hygrophoropsis aurantiaca TaxID=72124 RepID=A0ACB7ZPY9_9AGAM|nr:hypothetical protein BJ138DRAFT_1120937 [Hygrophoropsis aurantiaca]
MSSRQELESPGVAEPGSELSTFSGDLNSSEDLRPQASPTTVPETPNVLHNSLSNIKIEPVSIRLTRSVHRSPRTRQVPIGTQLAVGAIRGCKSFSCLSHITSISSPLQTSTTAEIQCALFARMLVPDIYRNFYSQIPSQNDAETSDAEDAEFERMESELVLEVMRCQRNIWSLENKLSEARLDENIAMRNLYKLHAENTERKLEGAEFDLGCVHNSICKNEASRQNPKRRRISSPRSEPAHLSSEA